MEKRALHDVLNEQYKAIGVDIDDSMISIGELFVKYAHKVFGSRLKHNFAYNEYSWMKLEEIRPFAEAGITRDEVSAMLKHMESDRVIENIMPRHHCIASLKTLSKKSDIYIVTSRGDAYYTDAEAMTNRWLDNIVAYNRFIPDGVIYNSDKANVALEKGIGLFFEDNPLVAERLLEEGIPVILFDAPWNMLNAQKDSVMLTERAYRQKKQVIRSIESYADTLLFRVPDWSHIMRNIK